jgi:hypothetical protein
LPFLVLLQQIIGASTANAFNVVLAFPVVTDGIRGWRVRVRTKQKMRCGSLISKPNWTNGKQKLSNPAAKTVKPSQNRKGRKGKYED